MEVITSTKNPWIKRLAKLNTSSSYRREEKTLLLEGKKLIEEWQKKSPVKKLFVKEGFSPLGETSPIYLKEELCKKISSLKTSDGYFAEIECPSESSLEGCSSVLVIDRLQDPGNLGTLIRSALAFNFDGLFILNHSVDPFSPKVIRSSMGACLHIPIMRGDTAKFYEWVESQKMNVYLADALGKPIEELKIEKPLALVLGNEANGTMLDHTSFQKVSIPIDNVDSLNVAIAGSLLMYQVKGAL